MMKIGVCFKIVPDYEEVPAADWAAMEQLDFTYVKKMYGCFDEAALETALRLRDSLLAASQNVSCTAVTVGGGPEVLLQGLYAAGFDEVVTIPTAGCGGSEFDGNGEASENLDFCPRETARLLAAYWKTRQPDLILTGRMTGPGDSGLVPVYLAAELGYQLQEEVTEALYHPVMVQTDSGEAEFRKETGSLSAETEARIEILQERADAEIRRLLTRPSVLVVGDAKAPNLRMFSLKARMEARKRKAAVWRPENGSPAAARTDMGMQPEPGGDGDTAAAGRQFKAAPPAVLLKSEARGSRCHMVEGRDGAEKASELREILNGEDGR